MNSLTFQTYPNKKIMKTIKCCSIFVPLCMVATMVVVLGVGFGGLMPNLEERADYKGCFILSKKIDQTQCCAERDCQCLECERTIPFCSTLSKNKTEGTCCGGLFCCTWLCEPGGGCSCFESVHHLTCKSVCKNCTLLYLEIEFPLNRTRNDTVTQMVRCTDTNCATEPYNKYRPGSTYRCWDTENNNKNYKVSFHIPALNKGALASFINVRIEIKSNIRSLTSFKP